MGEARKDALRVGFDRVIKLEFHGGKVSSGEGHMGNVGERMVPARPLMAFYLRK